MISEKERIKEWLSRVSDEVNTMKLPNASKQDKLDMIKENYKILAVLTKVAAGDAYLVGVPPINQISNK